MKIQEEDLAIARRKFARQVAASIIAAMAETDASFATISNRINKPEAELVAWMHRLLDGDGGQAFLDQVSDIFLAMGYELEFSVRPKAAQILSADPT